VARVYLPSTRRLLGEAVVDGGFGPPPFLAFAVTPALREWYAEGDIEELEYAAMTHAARASLHLLEGEAEQTTRVVVAIDVPDSAVQPAPEVDRAAVQIMVAVPIAKMAAVHIDAPEAAKDVQAAVAAVRGAESGDADAQFVVEAVEDHELLWYAPQEIRDLR
jgi:hypothetical protein